MGAETPASRPLRQHPIVAWTAFAFMIGCLVSALYVEGTQRLVTCNLLTTAAAVFLQFWLLMLVLPRFWPRLNSWLWEERQHVPVDASFGRALAAFFLAFGIIFLLVLVAWWKDPGMTASWLTLAVCLGVSAVFPFLLGILFLLQIARAFERLPPAMDLSRFVFVDATRKAFSDWGRLLILTVAAVTLICIQGGIVVTGGLATSFFSVLLVAATNVATLVSDRPIYPLFVLTSVGIIVITTHVIGSYMPPSDVFYPIAHVVVLLLSLFVGVLVEMGRRPRAPGGAGGEVGANEGVTAQQLTSS
jgi:hypothetical protein